VPELHQVAPLVLQLHSGSMPAKRYQRLSLSVAASLLQDAAACALQLLHLHLLDNCQTKQDRCNPPASSMLSVVIFPNKAGY
jgi:hypothetical protein